VGSRDLPGVCEPTGRGLKRLRVLHIDSGRDWRGGQRQVLLLATGLTRRKHRPLILAPPDSPLLRRARAGGIDAEPVSAHGDWDLVAAIDVRRRIKEFSADVVHAHDARSHAVALVALMGLEQPPLVVSRRVTFIPKSARLKYGNRVARFIAVSTAVKNAMVAGGIDPQRITVVHSGVEDPPANLVARSWRKELGWPDDSVVCGVVGAMTVEKGVADLAAIANQMDPVARARARIVLLGGARGGQVEIGGVTAFSAGFVEDIIPAVAGLDVLWHPSRAEGLGTSVIDAMALGVPPIAFAVGGIIEVVEHDVSGLLVAPGDLSAFSDAAERLIEDKGARARLGDAACVRARMFSVETMTRATEAVYYQLVFGGGND
jgi:glycosyltransferase involved in cell wall biosynthesis